MLESVFQHNLITKLKKMFPGCVILKIDPNYIQGMPDLLILYRKRWAALECKRAKDANKQANQPFWVSYLNDMSFASFIFPENEREVLDDLQRAFGVGRKTCTIKPKQDILG